MDQSLLFNLEDESLFLNIIETEEEYNDYIDDNQDNDDK